MNNQKVTVARPQAHQAHNLTHIEVENWHDNSIVSDALEAAKNECK